MTPTIAVYLETGRRRVFAGALAWPGWCRSGRDEDSALEALVAYGPRYAAALGRAAQGFRAAANPAALQVVEKLKGNATTDFGAPAQAPKADAGPLADADLERWATLLRASWAAFDTAARSNATAALRKGPRGGGRDLDAIVAHVLEADRAYLSRLGGRHRKTKGSTITGEMTAMRTIFLDTLTARARGASLPQGRRTSPLWTPRYAVRRSAWHALDHAWEIEDRAMPA